MKNLIAACAAASVLLFLTAGTARTDAPPAKARTVLYPATGNKPGYAVRFPWAYDAAHAVPLVIVLPPPGKKPTDALRTDEWEAVADRWGIVLLAPGTTELDGITSALASVRRQAHIEPERIYVYGDEATIPRDLPDMAAWATRTRQRKAGEAWQGFDRSARRGGPLETTAPGPHSITLVITGLSSDKGQVAVSLWNRAKGFGDDDKNAAASAVAPIAGGQATVTFTVREPGDYAVLVLHDRNSNGKMDTSLGFPLEGFGASGNPRVRMGAPGWDECRFTVASSDRRRRIVVKAVYLAG